MGVSLLYPMFKKLKNFLSALNRARKKNGTSRYVSREKFENLQSKYQVLIDSIASVQNPLLGSAGVLCVQAFKLDAGVKEVCFFISYAQEPMLKPHVAHHIEALLNANIAVVLIMNVDQLTHPPRQFNDLIPRLSGFYLRENMGFDFGAWSYLYSVVSDKLDIDRLYLVNDSMIGPLSQQMFDVLIRKIRASKADMLGLTSNANPLFHLQSFFMVLNRKVLDDQRFQSFFKNLWSLPTKEMVIEFYEVRLTKLIIGLGYKVETLYSVDAIQNGKSDLVIHHLDGLLRAGFPYVKTSMASKPEGQKILGKFDSII